MTIQPYPYQRTGIEFLKARKTALLADEMRLGKTAQAVRAAAECTSPHSPKTIGIVCPASVRETWRREFAKWWPLAAPTPHLHIQSYDRVTRGAFDPYQHFDVLILDEAHYLKTRTSKRTKKIFGDRKNPGVVHRADRIWALTGTPMPNHPGELFPLMAVLFPDALKSNGHGMDYWKFVNRFCSGYDNGFGFQITGGKNLPELKDRLGPYVLRRKQADVWEDLPPMRFDTVVLDAIRLRPDAADSKAWAEEAALAEQYLDAGSIGSIAPHVATLRRFIGEAKIEPVAEMLEDELVSGLGKVVVFAYHRDVVMRLSDRLEASGFETVILTGQTSPDERVRAVDVFHENSQVRVFIGQIQAAGTGIDLSAANDVVFAEYSWVPAENQQAAMRCQHPTKKRSTFVRFVSLADSLDERITEAVRRKTETISGVFA